ncbi:MAG: NAD(P)H-dependent oxidoreductase [Methylovirgula sp.]|uniref:FMN-dependent NADH-azoreductase n=1 Tax=Methylovirgula sp. TaxID=1978224 RepID=UPI00307681D3
MHMLHIVGSPRKELSASLDVATRFIEQWETTHSRATIDTLDVWTTYIPAFDGPALDAKYAGLAGRALTDEQKDVWAAIGTLAARFHCADVVLISVPMWNFGIPYRLKHLIDAVSQKNVLFTFDGENLNGLLNGKKMVIVAARGARLGGDYPEKDFDHQVAYLRIWARMVGITEVQVIVVEGTLLGREADEAARANARAQAHELAATL